MPRAYDPKTQRAHSLDRFPAAAKQVTPGWRRYVQQDVNALIFAVCLLFPGLQDRSPQPPLIQAIRKGDVAAVTLLLKAGANPNTHEIVTSAPSASEGKAGGERSEGETALSIAIGRQSLPLVKLLLDHKADPNGRSQYDWTPLMTACQYNNVDFVKLLLKRGAKPNLRNVYGDTAIIFAANVDRVQMVDELIKAGADMNGGTGQSALIIASMCGAKETVKLLLKKGADPNFHRPGYWTPLEYATNQYDDDIVRMLKKAGGKGRPKAALEKETAAESKKWQDQADAERKERVAKYGQYAKLVPEDTAVLDAAIDDMARYKGDDFELSMFSKEQKMILLDRTAGDINGYTEDQLTSELDEKKAGDLDLVMRRDLLRRNVKEVSLTGLKFSSSRIMLQATKNLDLSLRDFSFEKAGAKGWVYVFLPGYSQDGSKAVLRFWFGPTPHGAAGTYLLAKKDGHWTVVWRRFVHYF